LAGLDIVVMNQPAAATVANDAMKESLERHWQRCMKARTKPTEQES
jgi:hypothetical protein